MSKPLKRAIGILGGTFNPIHWGHLMPAKQIMEQLQLAQLRLLPNHKPPHKGEPHVGSIHRAEMTELACCQMDAEFGTGFVVDLQELNHHTPSYTVATLERVKQELPNTPICFLIGMDSLLSFKSWHQWQKILTLCHLVVSCRPGYQLDTQADINDLLIRHQTTNKSDLHNKQAGCIYLAQVQPYDISSSQIRQQISAQQLDKTLLPSSVADYISQRSLYQ